MSAMKEVLVEARRLLVEKGWTQRIWARKEDGTAATTDENAASYCALGALIVAAKKQSNGDGDSLKYIDTDLYITARTFLSTATFDKVGVGGQMSIMVYNDAKERTKEDMVALFDYAIERAP